MGSEDETQSSRRLLRKWDGTKPKPKRKRRVPWKPIAVVLVAVLICAVSVVTIVWLKPWNRNGGEDENVWIQYLTSFKLLSTSDNLPIENLLLGFGYPHLMPSVDQIENADNDEEWGTIDLSIRPFYENINVTFLSKENRQAPLIEKEISAEVFVNWTKLRLPILFMQVSELHVEEKVQVETWLRVPRKDIEKLTLIGFFPENFAGVICAYPPPPETFGTIVQMQMSMYMEQGTDLLENWARTINENIPNYVTIRLYL